MMATHEVFYNKNGTASIRHISSGEVMHSSVGPHEEATLLYIKQSRLEERLGQANDEPLVLFDVGLGAGTNALAALHCYYEVAKSKTPRRLHVVSFETDLSGIELALANKEKLPFIEEFEAGVRTLLSE